MNILKSYTKLLTALLFSFGLVIGVTGCASDGPMEEAGEEIDQAVDDAADEIEEAGDEIDDHVG